MGRGFLQVLGRAPWFMAGRLAHAQAVGLVVLFLLGSWGNVVEPARPVAEFLEHETDVLRVGPGDEMNLTLTTNPNTMFKLDLPDGEPLVSAELNFSPRILPRHQKVRTFPPASIRGYRKPSIEGSPKTEK